MRILLDCGHGGKDPGATGLNGTREKDITLAVVLACNQRLIEAGHEVFLSREDDTYISPSTRLAMINDFNPDAFVSVDCNASDNPQAHGIETIYRDDYDITLATNVQHALVLATGMTDRGIKQDIGDLGRKLAVLGNLRVAACLTEIGFITNPDDLEEVYNYDLIAGAICEGIQA